MAISSIKDYNIKIRSLNSTQKITKTMKMVSASKLRKAHEAQAAAKMYADKIAGLTCRISTAVHYSMHPLLKPKASVKNVLILIITSDRGLCGAFNHNVNKMVTAWTEQNRHHENIDLFCCGKRGYMFFKRHDIVKKFYPHATAEPEFKSAKSIGEDLSQLFLNGEYDEAYITYNRFINPLSQKTTFEKILPVDACALIDEEHPPLAEYIFEPKMTELLDYLIPHFLYFKIYYALLENSAGEHGARMTAMDSATKNAAELIDRYTLFRNRARQAAITTELSEIVAGAEAQK